MLSVGPTTRIFVALDPVDMRGSFDALAGQVRRLGADPIDGHLYLFLNRRRRLVKALWFDRTGFAIFSNQLASHYTSSGCRLRVDSGAALRRAARFSRVSHRLGAGVGGVEPGGSYRWW
jgi:hypothetical protein